MNNHLIIIAAIYYSMIYTAIILLNCCADEQYIRNGEEMKMPSADKQRNLTLAAKWGMEIPSQIS